jgi:hypothetical protein
MSAIRVSGTPRSVIAASAASSTCCLRSAVLVDGTRSAGDAAMVREV